MRHPNRPLLVAAISLALLVILSGVALAAGAMSDKFRTGDTVTIAAGQTVSTRRSMPSPGRSASRHGRR